MKRIYVNPTVIRENSASRKKPLKPPIMVETESGKIAAFAVDVLGESKVVYQRDGHVKDGVRCWIETSAVIIADGKRI